MQQFYIEESILQTISNLKYEQNINTKVFIKMLTL